MSADSDIGKQYRFAIRRPVSTLMLFLALIVFGWRSYQGLPLNLMPDVSYPSLTVRTEYEGAAPADVEMLVTRPMEELLSIVSGLVEISSRSSAGLSEIILEFTWGTDMNLAQQEVRDRLDLFDPPREVTRKPVVLRYDPTLDPVMRIAITSNDPAHTSGSDAERQALTAIRERTERRLKSDLEAERGIAQVSVKGGQAEEIQVLLDVERLKHLGISPEYVVAALAQQNVNLSGGSLREGDTEYLVRTLNEFATIEDVANCIVLTPSGVQRRLYELAEVFLGVKDRESIVHINGREAVAVDIFKSGDANTVQVCNKIRDLLGFERPIPLTEQIQAALRRAQSSWSRQGGLFAAGNAAAPSAPRGMFLDRLPPYAQLSVITDQSRFIHGAIREVQSAALFGGVLALLVLFLFLQELRSTVIIGVAIPISIIATFVPMFFNGVSLNIMSLGGLALGVGMLVDNSIVVLESVFRCREEGDSVRDSAERGTREVSGAVIASTLTTICVFLPVAFVEGMAGQVFGDLALSVTFSLLASLLTALYLIPLVVSRTAQTADASRPAVWVMRAYAQARAKGANRIGAFSSIPSAGFRNMRAFLAGAARESFGPACRRFRAAGHAPNPRSMFAAAGGVICLPPLSVLFLLHIALGAAGAVTVTVLFVLGVSLFLFLGSLRFLFNLVAFLPLRVFASGFEGARALYGVVLDRSLHFGPVVLLLVLLVSVHAGFLALELGSELMPPMKQGEFGIRMEIRAGARLEETEARARRFEALIRESPDVASVTVEIGRERRSAETERGENVAQFTVLLKDIADNIHRQDAIVDSLRERILAARDDETVTFTLPALFTFRSGIEVQLFADALDDLRQVGRRAVALLTGIEGLKDIELSMKPGYPELIIEMDRELLMARGLSPGQVAQRLRSEIEGEVATRFSRGADRVDIRVRAHRSLLGTLDDLRSLSVVDGPTPIPLSDVARIRIEEGPSEIRRVNQRRTVLITANVDGRDLAAVSADIDARLREMDMPSDMYYTQGGQRRELDTAFQSMRFAMILAAFLVYVVMACQFESLIQPALVMFSAPLAFIGVVYTLYFARVNLSVMVFLGAIVLMGIVVNNAIILVDYINQLRARGLPKKQAIVEAGKARLRPILMTTVTSVLGLAPMLVATGEGSEMRQPMALTVVAGLTSATLLTLFIIPMAYQVFIGKERV